MLLFCIRTFTIAYSTYFNNSCIVVGANWLNNEKEELVAAPCLTDTHLSCMWLKLQCTGGQVA